MGRASYADLNMTRVLLNNSCTPANPFLRRTVENSSATSANSSNPLRIDALRIDAGPPVQAPSSKNTCERIWFGARNTDDRRKALKKPGACLSGPTTRKPQTAFPSEAPQNPSSSEKYNKLTKKLTIPSTPQAYPDT